MKVASWCCTFAILAMAVSARAQPRGVPEIAVRSAAEDPAPTEPTEASMLFYGTGGVKALPFAEACPFSGAACEPGEVSLAAGLNVMGRIRNFGVGGGFTWATGLKTSEAAGAASLKRQHNRSYLLLDGQFRYFPPPFGEIVWWVGTSAGVIVINDSWTTIADREPLSQVDFVGPQAISLSTEGFAAGVELGGHWKFVDMFFVGTRIRYSNWVVPFEREQTPLGDLASLAGRIDVIDAGILLGFELTL